MMDFRPTSGLGVRLGPRIMTCNTIHNAFYEAEGLDPLPASTCIQARLCRLELLVEIEVMAVLPGERAQPNPHDAEPAVKL